MAIEIEKVKPERQALVFKVTTEYLNAVLAKDTRRIEKAFIALKEMQDNE
jgi:hypothetical protein